MFGEYAFMKDSCNASPELFCQGKRMNFSSREAVGERLCRLEQLEIFPLLPIRDLRVVAGDLGLLDAQVIVDEIFAEAGGKAGILAQRGEGLLEAFRQMRCLDFVGGVRRRAGIKRSLHAVEAGDDL